jgi:haloacetate dehalogenase
MEPVRKTCQLGEIHLSYLEWNQGTEPLLLLHGLADHALVWLRLGDDLSDRYHIVAVDMRGHGESSKPESGYRFVDAIADLEGLMDALGWSDAHVVGHSWTGKLLPIWAAQNPQRLRTMTLVDPIFIFKMPNWSKVTFPFLYRVLPFLKGMGPFANYEEALAKGQKMSQYRDWNDWQKQVFVESIEEKPDGTWGSKFTIPARDEIFTEVMQVAGLTQSIETPTLFVQPERGVNRMEWQLKPYKKHLPNLQLRRVPGNHWTFLVEPDAFNRTVETFLEAHRGQPPLATPARES